MAAVRRMMGMVVFMLVWDAKRMVFRVDGDSWGLAGATAVGAFHEACSLAGGAFHAAVFSRALAVITRIGSGAGTSASLADSRYGEASG